MNCVVYLLMKKPQELDRCPTFGAHFTFECIYISKSGRGLAPDEALIHHAEFKPGGLTGLIQHTELIAAQALETGIDAALVGTVAQWRAVEEPPAPAAAAQGR